VDLEVRRRSVDFVDDAQHVRDGEIVQPRPHRAAIRAGPRQGVEHPIERAALAEIEQLVFAREVVIQVAGREVGGRGDIAHAGGGEADLAKCACGGAQDLHAARIGAM